MKTEVLATLLRRKGQQIDEGDKVFPSIKCDYASRQFKRAAKVVLGIKTHVHFHSLRHSFCSNLVCSGSHQGVSKGCHEISGGCSEDDSPCLRDVI
jgi:integrase